MKLVDFPAVVHQIGLYHVFEDDFSATLDTNKWTVTVPDTGTIVTGDAANGIVTLTPSDGTIADNDEAYLYTDNEAWLFADDKPVILEARIQYAEAATNAANIVFGLMDAPGADAMVDNGAGPKASFSGALIYKVDGNTVWQCINSITTARKVTVCDAAGSLTKEPITAGGSAYQTLRIEHRPITSTKADVTFFVDGVCVAKHKDQPLASATEMKLLLGSKNGSANQQTLLVDYVIVAQKR